MYPNSLLAILLSLFLLHKRTHADSCEPATCGNLTVRYPFWLGAPCQTPPDPSCGPPAFELWCAGDGTNTTSASLRGSAIHVLGIDYAARTFVASHARVATGDNGACRADLNVSSNVALSPFWVSATNRALCFLYDCNGTEPRGPEYVNASAGCGRLIYAYLAGSYNQDTPPAISLGSCRRRRRQITPGCSRPGSSCIGRASASGTSGGECRYSNATAGLACLCPGSTCAGEPPNSYTFSREFLDL
jgi:hypothetical protein